MSSLHSTLIPLKKENRNLFRCAIPATLRNTRDSFRKVVILDGNARPWTDEDGVNYMGVIPFMLDPNLLRF